MRGFLQVLLCYGDLRSRLKRIYLRCFRVVLVAAAISMAYKGILGEEKFYMYPQYR